MKDSARKAMMAKKKKFRVHFINPYTGVLTPQTRPHDNITSAKRTANHIEKVEKVKTRIIPE